MWKMPIRLRHRLISRHPITTFIHATDESEIKNALISIEELALVRLYALGQSNVSIRYRKEQPCTTYNWYIPERRPRQSTAEAILLYAFSLVLTYSQSSLIARPVTFYYTHLKTKINRIFAISKNTLYLRCDLIWKALLRRRAIPTNKSKTSGQRQEDSSTLLLTDY